MSKRRLCDGAGQRQIGEVAAGPVQVPINHWGATGDDFRHGNQARTGPRQRVRPGATRLSLVRERRFCQAD